MSVSAIELATLAATHDIISLGMQADDERQRRHGTRTTFVRVAVVGAEPGTPVDWPAAAGEVRIAGVPRSRADAVARVVEVVAAAKGVPVSAYSLADLDELSTREGTSLRSLLDELRAGGADLVAEAPFDRLTEPARALESVGAAGLGLARLTVHKLPAGDLLAFFTAIAAMQQSLPVVRAFAPLPRTSNAAVPSTGYDDVKRVALARLIVDNVSSIQVDWSLYGPKLAQIALTVGADDVDGVSPEGETAEGRRRAPLEEIRRNIRAAGQDPVERDGRFAILSPRP